MIIGSFKSERDGFIGHIITLSLGTVPVVFVPADKEDAYVLLIVGPNDETTIEMGFALHKQGPKGGHLEVQIDCPALAAPINAVMKLKPSREGIYTLQWKRLTKPKKN